MQDLIKLAIVDDHQIIIEGLELLLSFEKNINIIKTYTDGFELIEDLRSQFKIDLVLLDLMMPKINGVECSKIIKKEFPEIKIIILSMNNDTKTIYELVQKIGVEGYLSKSISRKELAQAIQDVQLGYLHLSEEADEKLKSFKEKIIQTPDIKLSAREKEIVDLMIKGFTNKEIAEKLFISESTVETHRKNIYRKTEVHSLPKLIQLVSDLDLLTK